MRDTKILRTNFSNCKLEFEHSEVSEMFLSETDFPEGIFLNGKKDYGQAKLLFGQLHTLFVKQGDSVRAYEYLAREVKAYYHTIPLFSKFFFTKTNLFFNWVSNNFGRSWFQGVIFSFIVGFLFFYLLMLSSVEFKFGLPVTIDWNYTSSFLKFMNPLRHFETEALFRTSDKGYTSLTLTNLSYVWDFIGRVFVAYGYYQTIQAFRKFGRK
jgi:hypothetical protein